MASEYKRTFVIQGRVINETVDASAILSDLIAANAYVSIIRDERLVVLSIGRLMTNYEVVVDTSLTIGVFVSDHLTDEIVDSLYSDDVIPLRNVYTKAFDHRMVVVDPQAITTYDVAYTSIKTPSLRNEPTNREWANDLVISSNDADVTLDNAIVAVNGIFHKHVLFNDELFVAGGFANMKMSGGREVTLIDTASLGGHEIVPITAEMIVPVDSGPLIDGFKLKLPTGKVFGGKTALLVIHGQMMILDASYQIVSPSVMKVNMNAIDLVHLVIHHPMTKWSRRYRAPGLIYPNADIPNDPDALPDLYDDQNPLYADPIDESTGVVTVANITSDTNITNMLVEGQSFIVLINNPDVYQKQYNLRPAAAVGIYELISEDTPRGLLQYNKMWSLPFTILSSEDHQHTVSVNARRIGDDLYKTMLDQSIVDAPWFDSREKNRQLSARLIELYSV